eukprot:scaffold2378_cov117-Cylindrotheca_fusiformis.AAC.1
MGRRDLEEHAATSTIPQLRVQKNTLAKMCDAELSPVLCCHTPESFESRVWDELEHCALAYHMVNMIVLSTNQSDGGKVVFTEGDKGINPTNILSFPFLALSPCLCHHPLLIKNLDSIRNNPVFKNIWLKHLEQPYALFRLANMNQKHGDEIKSEIGKVLESLRNERCARKVLIVPKEEDQPTAQCSSMRRIAMQSTGSSEPRASRTYATLLIRSTPDCWHVHPSTGVGLECN